MKIPLVARPRRQNASARGLALSFPPLKARLQRKFPESARVDTTFALRPDPARKRERELLPPALTAERRFPV
eukprot:2726771-Pleurochrysis_carterae.AAC.3